MRKQNTVDKIYPLYELKDLIKQFSKFMKIYNAINFKILVFTTTDSCE